jgi:hypothetical protein
MSLLNIELIKEAGVLRKRLAKGSFNTNEIEQFLAKVEALKSSPERRKNTKAEERFLWQMENLERGRARKPIIH